CDDHRPGIELYRAHAPGRALTKVGVGRGPHRRLGYEHAARVDVAKWKARRQTRGTGVARRIENGVAIEANLQREASLCGGGGEPSYRFRHSEKSTGRASLPDRKLAARGIVGKRAVGGEAVGAHKIRSFALLAEAEILELHHHDDRVVVIGLDQTDLMRAQSR